jgi:hypothetical protein
MDSAVPYVKLIEQFAVRLGVDVGQLDPDTALEFGHEDLVAQIYRHPTRESIVIDVQICEIDPYASEAVNLQRLLLLHQLNDAARFAHEALATVTPENVLLLTRTIALADMDADALMLAFNDLIERARDLRDGWSSLWEAFDQMKQPEPVMTAAIRG